MPNPFPGMNPYMEESADWRGVHTALILRISDALNAVLPSDYVATLEVRYVISHFAHAVLPDVAVLESRSFSLPRSTGGTIVLDRPQSVAAPSSSAASAAFDAPLVLRVEELEEEQSFINIMHIRNGKFRDAELVTSIEILSLTNKNTRDDGYKKYRHKQEQVLSSQANLLEIDLLRAGAHTAAVPQAALPTDCIWHYIICLHRGTRPHEYSVWLNSLRDPLPCVEVPLAQGDPSVALDLQTVLNLSYDVGAFDRQMDYTQEADPSLQGDDALWADALLRAQGLRA